MKFLADINNFQLLYLTIFFLEIYGDLQVVNSINTDITVLDTRNDSFSQTVVDFKEINPNKSLKSTKITKGKRRQKRRKRKNRPTSSTAAPFLEVNTNANFKNFPNTTVTPIKKPKRRKLKTLEENTNTTFKNFLNTTASPIKKPKRRKIKTKQKNGFRKNKKHLTTTTSSPYSNNLIRKYVSLPKSPVLFLEPDSLVLPIIPNSEKNDSEGLGGSRKITRCSKNNGGCAHLCLSKGVQKCQCLRGFRLADDEKNCIDINECSNNNHGCQMNCTNTIGSYRCQCPRGLRLGFDSKSCEDVNECLLRNGHGPCQDVCKNTHGGYKCSCNGLKGTKLADDLRSCVDEDECLRDNGGCSHICINTFGRSFCSCPEGFELSLDFQTCQDVNECEIETINKSCPNGCINTAGSYKCANISELQNDETYTEVACKPLFPPKHGYFKCSRKHAIKTYTKSGRRRTRNSLGTKCILVCPEGFKRIGRRFKISCGIGGQWFGDLDSKCVPIRQELFFDIGSSQNNAGSYFID